MQQDLIRKKRIEYIILLNNIVLIVLFPMFTFGQTLKADMDVFGYKIGEPLNISECRCSVHEDTLLGGTRFHRNIVKFYQYIDNSLIDSDCFERIKLDQYRVKKKEALPILEQIKTGKIEIHFSKKNKPQICAQDFFYAGISDSKLTDISFKINSINADRVMSQLKKKYGSNYIIKSFKAQNHYGATIEYYVATWRFSNLTVTFSSSTATTIDDPYGEVWISLPSTDNKPDNDRGL